MIELNSKFKQLKFKYFCRFRQKNRREKYFYIPWSIERIFGMLKSFNNHKFKDSCKHKIQIQ